MQHIGHKIQHFHNKKENNLKIRYFFFINLVGSAVVIEIFFRGIRVLFKFTALQIQFSIGFS